MSANLKGKNPFLSCSKGVFDYECKFEVWSGLMGLIRFGKSPKEFLIIKKEIEWCVRQNKVDPFCGSWCSLHE